MGRRKSVSSAEKPVPATDSTNFSTFPRRSKSTSSAPGTDGAGRGRGRGRGRGGGTISGATAPTKAFAKSLSGSDLKDPQKGPGGGGFKRSGSVYQRKTGEFLGTVDITRAKWYLGLANRLECDKAVLAADHGDFLVRMSSKKDKYVVVVNDNGSPQNFLCHINPASKKIKMGGVEFDGIMEALQYLKVNPLHSKSKNGGLYVRYAPCIYVVQYVLGNPACEKEWYVGTMERNECEKMVMAAGKCDYLVRLASDMKNYAIVINQGDGSCKHCKIFADVNSFTLATKTAKSMSELLEEIKSVPIYGNDGKSILYLRKAAARADYYVGNMPRAEAEGYVKKSGTGDYLIRQNSKGDKYVLVVNGGGGEVKNFIIAAQPDGKFSFGGLPHESLEMVIRFLRKTPLMGAGNKPMYINKPALTTDAEDMIADAEFSFGGKEQFADIGAGFSRKSSFSGGMPMFDSDDDEEVEAYVEKVVEEDEEEYDAPVKPEDRMDPFRAECVKAVTGVCKVGDALFVISKNGDKYRAVFQGEQVEVPMSSVEAVAERRAPPPGAGDDFGGADEDDDDDDDDDDFGGFEEVDEEELARKKAEREAEVERLKAESAARIAALEAGEVELDVETEEEKAEKARLEEAARKLQEELAALENEEIGGFGDEDEDDM